MAGTDLAKLTDVAPGVEVPAAAAVPPATGPVDGQAASEPPPH
jgi:hypothetical protein